MAVGHAVWRSISLPDPSTADFALVTRNFFAELARPGFCRLTAGRRSFKLFFKLPKRVKEWPCRAVRETWRHRAGARFRAQLRRPAGCARNLAPRLQLWRTGSNIRAQAPLIGPLHCTALHWPALSLYTRSSARSDSVVGARVVGSRLNLV